MFQVSLYSLHSKACPRALPTSKCLVSSGQQAVEHVEVALARVLSNNSVLQEEQTVSMKHTETQARGHHSPSPADLVGGNRVKETTAVT